MNPGQVVDDVKAKLAEAKAHFEASLKSLRTGRASASMLDGVTVEAYGTPMPLNQVATVTAPEAQLIQITPFDPSNLAAISTAIRNNQQLGLNPSDDGRVVRVPVPPLTEERRRELARQISDKTEEAYVRMRGARHDAMGVISNAKKGKEIGEDEAKRLEKAVEDVMNDIKSQIEVSAKAKEQELLTL